MRLHPSSRGPFSSRWQFMLLFGVLGAVLLFELQRNRMEPEPAVATIQIPMKKVVVAKVQLDAGKVIAKESIVIEERPLSTLPADVAIAFEEIVGKKPVGVIPAKYPLAKSLVAVEPEKVVVITSDPAEEKLSLLRKETVGFAVNFSAAPPPKGTRVAIVLQGAKGGSALVADEAWIDDSDGKAVARVLLRPSSALFFQEAKTLGSFSYLVIPPDGASPFESKAVKNIADLTAELSKGSKGEKPDVAPVSTPAPPPQRPAGYAWVPGENVRYSVGKDGSINVLGRKGESFPLRGGGGSPGAPSEANTQGGDQKAADNSEQDVVKGLQGTPSH